MARLGEIVAYCNALLKVDDFRDYCPNGLQLEGKAEVKKIVAGVTASQALLDAAIEQGADAVLVHHGYFWKGEEATIVGIKKNRIRRLLEQDVSLLAYHLPLDAHEEYGNNIELARKLGISVDDVVRQGAASGLLWYGQLATELEAEQLAQHIETTLQRRPLHLPSASQRPIRHIGWCSGGAQGYIEEAAKLGLDAFISGEVSEQTFHLARELDIHYFAAGHHATERYGVQALGAHLAQRFDLDYIYIDVDNPV